MKSIHWLIADVSMWFCSAAAAVYTSNPLIFWAPASVTITLIVALALSGKITQE